MNVRFIIYFLLLVGIGVAGYGYWIQSQGQVVESKAEMPVAKVQSAEQPKPQYQGAFFLAANRPLAKGALVQPSDVSWRQKAQNETVSDLERYYLKGVSSPDMVEGFVVRHPLKAGEFISKGNFIRPGDFNYLSAVLKPGMRAVSIPIDIISGSSGLIKPGNSVDVIITTNMEGEGMSGRELSSIIAKTILTNVRVLAINQNVENLTESEAFDLQQQSTATLETTAKQAEILTVARKMGELSLSLRSEFSQGEADLPGSTTTASQITNHIKAPITSPSMVLMHGVKRRNLSVADSGVEVLAD